MTTTGIDLYHQLSRRNLTHSLRDFSSYYLGMAENYACLRGDRPPSERALIHLFRRLWGEGHYILAVRVAWAILWETGSDA
ncbi:MAG: hypothetical protein U1C74_09145 [Phenylobacterium sp.]|nr:hypothetical protein [Phenylobacterium sp.]